MAVLEWTCSRLCARMVVAVRVRKRHVAATLYVHALHCNAQRSK